MVIQWINLSFIQDEQCEKVQSSSNQFESKFLGGVGRGEKG